MNVCECLLAITRSHTLPFPVLSLHLSIEVKGSQSLANLRRESIKHAELGLCVCVCAGWRMATIVMAKIVPVAADSLITAIYAQYNTNSTLQQQK